MKYILSVIGMIIFGVVAVVLFVRFTSNSQQDVQVGDVTVKTTDYINDKTKVEYTRYGSVVSDEERRTLKIYVTERERVIEVLKGYQGTIETRKTYPNNADSYYVFMNALENAGFTRKKGTKVTNPTGDCPDGSTYWYKLQELDNEISNLWNSACKPLGGDLGNNGATIRKLFTNQIPDYSTITQNVDF